jgi:hypothetical protein
MSPFSSPKTLSYGFRSNVSRYTLAHSNQIRDWRIHADFAQILIGQARRLYTNDSFGVELDQTAYALTLFLTFSQNIFLSSCPKDDASL